MTIMGIGFCLLFLAAMIAVQVVLPIYLLIKAGKFLWRYFNKEKAAAAKPPQPEPGLREMLSRDRGPTAAGRAEEPESVRAEADAAAKQRAWEERVAVLKTQGNLDRLALVYYVEDALKSGHAAGDIAAALRAKGWPEEEIAAVIPGGEETAPA